MASMKNTIVLGCFILASVVAHAFMSGRYESVVLGRLEYQYRFDTWTGQFHSWTKQDDVYKWYHLTGDPR